MMKLIEGHVLISGSFFRFACKTSARSSTIGASATCIWSPAVNTLITEPDGTQEVNLLNQPLLPWCHFFQATTSSNEARGGLRRSLWRWALWETTGKA